MANTTGSQALPSDLILSPSEINDYNSLNNLTSAFNELAQFNQPSVSAATTLANNIKAYLTDFTNPSNYPSLTGMLSNITQQGLNALPGYIQSLDKPMTVSIPSQSSLQAPTFATLPPFPAEQQFPAEQTFPSLPSFPAEQPFPTEATFPAYPPMASDPVPNIPSSTFQNDWGKPVTNPASINLATGKNLQNTILNQYNQNYQAHANELQTLQQQYQGMQNQYADYVSQYNQSETGYQNAVAQYNQEYPQDVANYNKEYQQDAANYQQQSQQYSNDIAQYDQSYQKSKANYQQNYLNAQAQYNQNVTDYQNAEQQLLNSYSTFNSDWANYDTNFTNSVNTYNQNLQTNLNNTKTYLTNMLQQLESPQAAQALIMGTTATFLQNVYNGLSPYMSSSDYNQAVSNLQSVYGNDEQFVASYNNLFQNYLGLNVNLIDSMESLQPAAAQSALASNINSDSTLAAGAEQNTVNTINANSGTSGMSLSNGTIAPLPGYDSPQLYYNTNVGNMNLSYNNNNADTMNNILGIINGAYNYYNGVANNYNAIGSTFNPWGVDTTQYNSQLDNPIGYSYISGLENVGGGA
jgi:hypothetical protein